MELNNREQKAKRKAQGARCVRVYFLCSLLSALCSLPAFNGCASVSQKETVLAVVDNEPVTEGDLRYSLNIAHRREDLSSASALNLSEYVRKLVDDRLIINEARSAGMDKYPEVQQAVEAYVLRESVVRLRDEEVARKVSVTEEEIRNYYKTNYEKFIMKSPGREEAPDGEFRRVGARIEKAVRRRKEQERSDEYLKYLRERAAIKTDMGLLSQIKLGGETKELEKLKKDSRVLAEVDGSALTVGDLIETAGSPFSKSPENMVNNWIDRKVIDHEALRRHYEKEPDLKKMVRRYEGQLLKSTFIRRIIMPRIIVTDEKLKEYYSKNQSSFLKPVRFKIQQITVGSTDDAQEIVNNLMSGADFAWVARKKSIDAAASKGGEAGWFKKEELPQSFGEIIDTLNTGDPSPIVKLGSSYGIFRIQERTTKELEAFNKVRDAVLAACVSEQVNNLLDKYINQLKAGANIRVYNDEIRKIEEKFKR